MAERRLARPQRSRSCFVEPAIVGSARGPAGQVSVQRSCGAKDRMSRMADPHHPGAGSDGNLGSVFLSFRPVEPMQRDVHMWSLRAFRAASWWSSA